MGCAHSMSNDHDLSLNGLEYSITELSIAKRPGGRDVGPIHVERISEGSTPGESEVELEPTSEPAVKPKKLPHGELNFSVVKVVADEDGVMFYHFCGTSAEDQTNEVRIAKRYSDFKMLHSEISELMANERNVPPAQQYLFETYPALPEMPKANAWTYLRGRYSEKVLEERELQFTRILNAISRHPVAFHCHPFSKFLQT